MSYDPELRRETPLALALRSRIQKNGPLRVDQYMDACLHDASFGYYRTRDAIGISGDFTTAPEISQVFGELIGLWSAVVWQQMGSPKPFRIVEIGPGRGTMMRDALRAVRIVPGLMDAVEILLIDTDPALIEAQKTALAEEDSKISWLASIHDLLAATPTIVLANEYLDTRGVQQYIVSNGQIYERTVELDFNERFVFGRSDTPELNDVEWVNQKFGDFKDGTIIELQPTHQPTEVLRQLAKAGPMAALFIDYGQTGFKNVSIGDTLQAVRQHQYEHVFTSPGEADLTAQVNFTNVAQNALDAGFAVDGPITQAALLGRLGVIERASKLMAANPARAGEIEGGVLRLMAPNGMGTRFKAIAIRSLELPILPGF